MVQAKKALAKSTARRKVKRTSRTTAQTYQNYIGGKWVPSASGETFENVNPADVRDVIGRFPISTREDVDAAVDAAKEAYKSWRLVPAPKRAEILYRTAELLVKR